MFDLHSHSICSDGSESPTGVVDIAIEAGLDLFALTDHDCTSGVSEAMEYASSLGLPMLTGAEMEAEYPATLHLLTIGMNINNSEFKKLVKKQTQFRDERNEKLEKLLNSLGMDVHPVLNTQSSCITRAHYAKALVDLGFANSMNDAFTRILGNNGKAYVKQQRLKPNEIINATLNAGGIVVLAHPMLMKYNSADLIDEMKKFGVWGVEAYYYASSHGKTRLFSSLARSHDLYITCGSDFHGADRPKAKIGCCYKECEDLIKTREELNRLFGV